VASYILTPAGGVQLGATFDGSYGRQIDSFTDTAGTALVAHLSDSGGSWALASGFIGSAVITAAQRLRQSGPGAVLATLSVPPSSADAAVAADVYVASTGGAAIAGVAARVGVSGAYAARLNLAGPLLRSGGGPDPPTIGGNVWELYRLGMGTGDVLLGSVAASVAAGATYRLALVPSGNSLTLIVDGVATVGPLIDTAVAGPGQCGLIFTGGGSTDTTGPHLDNWQMGSGIGLAQFALPAAGGVQDGGSAPPAAALQLAASGGLQRGGTAPLTGVFLAAPAGGLQLGSTAAGFAVAAHAAPSGGVQLAAAAPAAFTLRLPAAGGVQLAAAAGPQGSLFTATASGGLQQGGSSTLIQTYSLTGSGGLQGGGLGLLNNQQLIVLAGSGGLQQGGSAAPSWAWALPAAGGAQLGGTDVQIAGTAYVLQPSGGVQLGLTIPTSWGVITYSLYANDGNGGPIDYNHPIFQTSGISWTSELLATPGDYKWGLRASYQGLEEKNLSCAVELVLDTSGRDITFLPLPPLNVTCIPIPPPGTNRPRRLSPDR
jgi:hypothetical protein